MKEHNFTLILSVASELTSELADALYEATGGDIEFGVCDGLGYIDFERAAPSLREAILSAIRDVEGAGVGLHVDRVDSEVASTVAQVNAELAQHS